MPHKYNDFSPALTGTIEEIRRPREQVEVHDDSPDKETTVGGVELAIHFMFAVILGWGMYWSIEKVNWAIVASVFYFLPVTTFRVLAKTGTLKSWFYDWMAYKLEKHRIDTISDLELRRMEIMAQIENWKLPQPTTEVVSQIEAHNYVTPYTPSAIGEACAWAESLYGADGYIDTKKVHPNGKVKVSVVGSQRAGGSKDAQKYLVARKFLKMETGGAWINVRRYPTLTEIVQLRAQ